MARTRKKIGGAGNYKRYTTWSDGDWISGKFISKGIDKTYDKPFYVVKIEDFGMADPLCSVSKKKEKEGAKGKPLAKGMELTLNSAGSLNWKMDELEIGDEIEVVYKGMEALPEDHKNSGAESHQFDVFALGDEDEEENETDGL